MIEFIQNFHFLRPWYLLFLLIPVFFYFIKLKNITYFSSWENVCDKNLLKFLLISNGTTNKTSLLKKVYIGLITASLACAGPAWKKIDLPAFSVENPNMFIISLAHDMLLKDITPSRLERAKFMLSDIADNINQGQFGLEVYSQEPYTITPFTEDVELIKNLLPQIVSDIVPDQGDRLDRALDLAFERFKAAGYVSGNIILFASDVGQRFDLALEKAKEASSSNFTISVIDTSYDGCEKLQLLAETGNGVYANVQAIQPTIITKHINNINQERIIQTKNSRQEYADYGYYLLFIPLICFLPFFRKGMLILMLCLFSFKAQAGFLLNDNQEGLAYFEKKQYEQALTKFKNPDWRGVTLYKKNQLDEALKEFEKSGTSDAIYNRGVIAAKLCKYSEAQDYFIEALKKDPQNTDAHYNLQILAKLFEKAKEDPSVLECEDQQKQNDNKNNKDEQQQQNDADNDNKNKQDSNKENDTANSDNNQKKEENSNDSSENQQTDDKQNSEKENRDNTQKSQENSDSSNSSDSKNDKDTEDDEDNSSQQSLSENSKESDKNSSQNDTKTQNNNTPEDDKQTDLKTQMAEAKNGNNNENLDEEALAIQRRYREIPEDTGGLLREFIKKEYLKGRYRNENL